MVSNDSAGAPDSQRPFVDADEWRENSVDGRPGMVVSAKLWRVDSRGAFARRIHPLRAPACLTEPLIHLASELCCARGTPFDRHASRAKANRLGLCRSGKKRTIAGMTHPNSSLPDRTSGLLGEAIEAINGPWRWGLGPGLGCGVASRPGRPRCTQTRLRSWNSA